MRFNQHWLRSTALAGLVLCGSGLAVAQQPQSRGNAGNSQRSAPDANQSERQDDASPASRTERRSQTESTQRNQGQRGERATAASTGDGALAACLIIDNNKEIALAQLAQEKSQNEQVKAFAQTMIQDHQQFAQQLQQAAASGGYSEAQLTLGESQQTPSGRQSPSQGTRRQATPDAADTAQSPTEGQARDRRTARPAELETGHSGQAIDFISLKQEVAAQCLATEQQELSQSDQAEFDMHYIASQVMAHQGMQDTLTVFAKHASPELRQTLEQGLQKTREHLQQAKQIKEQLIAEAKSGNAGNPQRRDTDTQTNN